MSSSQSLHWTFSNEWFFIWAFRLVLYKYPLSHILQTNDFSFVWTAICFLTSTCLANIFLQTGHSTPCLVWMNLWPWSVAWDENVFPQYSQEYGFDRVCVIECNFLWVGVVNAIGQYSHLKGRSPVCIRKCSSRRSFDVNCFAKIGFIFVISWFFCLIIFVKVFTWNCLVYWLTLSRWVARTTEMAMEYARSTLGIGNILWMDPSGSINDALQWLTIKSLQSLHHCINTLSQSRRCKKECWHRNISTPNLSIEMEETLSEELHFWFKTPSNAWTAWSDNTYFS